jgi:1-acyl-sn-glycerol-3-phosphate acyltransferase
MTGGILYWGIGGLLVTLIGGPLHLILPKPLGVRFGRRLMQILFRQFVGYLRLTGLVRADLSALDSLAKLNHPVIVAPNHTSLWDAVFIIARLPQAICVMKKSILCNPFLGGGARLAGYIPNGTTTRMIRDAADALSHGGQLLLFPEGTRTRPDARWINPLKGGCALIAARAQVPVHPVFIRSNTRFLQKGWPLWKPPVFPIHISIETGPALNLLPACPPGHYCPGWDILPCPPGAACPGWGAFNFTPCAPGTFQPRAGATACLPCPVGFLCSDAGRVRPTLCPAGSVCGALGAAEPSDACPPGHTAQNTNINGPISAW